MDESTQQLQPAELAALRDPNLLSFISQISPLLSPCNERRSRAELVFNHYKQTDPDSLFLKLADVLRFPYLSKCRALSAVLLRQFLTRGKNSLWPQLSSSTQSEIKSVLLSCIQQEENKSNVKMLCYTVSDIASNLLPSDEWPELLIFMLQCVRFPSPEMQELGFLTFAQLSKYIKDTYKNELHTAWLQSWESSPCFDVKIASLNAVINFVLCLDRPSDQDKFQDLLPAMLRTLTEALNDENEATAQELLKQLIELAGTKPRFLQGQLVDVVGAMLRNAEDESLEEGTRHLAIEFVVTLAKAAPEMMRELPQSISKLFGILMRMLLDIEDDPAWYSAEKEDEGAGESNNYCVGKECLDRLAISLGGNTIVPVAYEQLQLPAYLAALEWQKRHAALIALAQLAEGCSKVIIKNIEHVVSMVLNSFSDPHPRVRWASINAIRQLFSDLGLDLHNQYHQRVLPALASAMDDFQNPRVQAHAASAVLKFSEKCTPESLAPYLDGIVGKLLVLLQGKNKTAEERRIAIFIFNCMVEQCHEAVHKYYDTFLPLLLKACDDKNPDVREAAFCGLRVCAEFGGLAFKPFVAEAFSRLNVVIQQPENIMGYGSAFNALIWIHQFHRDCINSSQIFS